MGELDEIDVKGGGLVGGFADQGDLLDGADAGADTLGADAEGQVKVFVEAGGEAALGGGIGHEAAGGQIVFVEGLADLGYAGMGGADLKL
ncbi:MAG: hypothetical protein OXI70_00255 [Chloroflexota bacterium]|nr:hypothetical protein [Chloroflexota bacterium]